MKLDEVNLPALPDAELRFDGEFAWSPDYIRNMRAYGLACARAGALAALDEAFNLCANDPDHRLEVIRRLHDTIAKGESE